MTTWPTVELKSLVREDRGISYGIVQPGMPTANGVPIVRVSDVRNGRIDASSPLKVDRNIETSYARTRLRGGELLITVVGTIGETAIVPEHLIGWNVARAIAVLSIEGDVGAYWVKLALCSPAARQMIQSHLNTTVQPTLNLGVVAKLPIILPPRQERERIISILGGYDGLIEVNRRRIALLEELARRLFEEWFVRFRFPGKEGLAIVETPKGTLPQAWQWGKISDFVQFKSGFPFKSRTFSSAGEYRIVTIRNVQDGAFNTVCDSRIEHLPPNLPSHCLLTDGDILISLTGNVGRVCLVYDGPFLLNQRVALLAPIDPMDRGFVYCSFRQTNMRSKLELTSNGVAQKNLSPIVAASLPYVVPPLALRRRFDAITHPMMSQIITLLRMQARLAASRDLLLPRLISGELSVLTAERELEAVA